MRLKYWYRSFFLGRNFFKVIPGLALLFFVGYWWEWLFTIAVFFFVLIIFAFIWDAYRLYRKSRALVGGRVLPDKLSNGDENQIDIFIENKFPYKVHVEIIDELPVQFQLRDFLLEAELEPWAMKKLSYTLTPKLRGEYFFGKLHVFVQSTFGLFKRRFSFQEKATSKVYPSFIHMRKHSFITFKQKSPIDGLKKMRKLGQSMEFEHIKDYVLGDDIRNMNWKASAKRANLMVNVFQEHKSQPVYVLLDTGRTMKMPFGGLSLLDYSVNSALAFANICLKMGDKVGLISFSKSLQEAIPSSNRKGQLGRLSDSLYRLATGFPDTDFGHLYAKVNRVVPSRSLLLMFTNFEYVGAMVRQIPYLQALNRKHVLVVIIFENTVLSALAKAKVNSSTEVYEKTIAQKLTLEKKQMKLEMERRGISCLLTSPEELTVNTVNRYLWLKARNII